MLIIGFYRPQYYTVLTGSPGLDPEMQPTMIRLTTHLALFSCSLTDVASCHTQRVTIYTRQNGPKILYL